MVNTIRALRILVLCLFGLIALEVVALFWQVKVLPPLLQEYLASEHFSPFTLPTFIYVVGGVVPFAGFVIASIGLLRLWRPARELFLASLVAMELVGLFSRPKVFAPLVGVIDTLGSMLAGAIIAITYFTEVRVLFRFSESKLHPMVGEPPNPPLNPTGAKSAPAG